MGTRFIWSLLYIQCIVKFGYVYGLKGMETLSLDVFGLGPHPGPVVTRACLELRKRRGKRENSGIQQIQNSANP